MGWLTERRRRHLLETPFPAAWRPFLASVVGYKWLTDDERERLAQLVQVFVAEKHWEGAGGLELDDEIRVTIAAQACVMIVARDHELFADVLSIIVYPSGVYAARPQLATYSSTQPVSDADPVLGLAMRGGPVVLAWDSVQLGLKSRDGRNLVIHEMTHKIDSADHDVDGTPPLPDRTARRAWHDAFEPAFRAHQARAARGGHGLVRDYAITNEAEYFACVTEVFFEKPRALADELPEVYAQLAAFYRLDLAERASHPAHATHGAKS